MEKTSENKARFAAQYWGQPVLKSALLNSPESEPVGALPNKIASPFTYLLLKPLSAISDTEAIEYDELLMGKNFWAPEYYPEGVIKRVKDKETEKTLDMIPLKGAQYLQSKGYALPWMGLSVEQLVEYGWIKLTS